MIERSLKSCLILVCALLIGSSTAFAQRQISGKVSDAESGEPLIGASVTVTGTTVGAITDFDGNFKLNLPADATTLRVAYTGYSEQTIAVGATTAFEIKLSAGLALAETVIIGYGRVKREDLTGSVQAVGVKDFNRGAITGPQELLAGKVAGVQVTTGADPGGGATIRIRGGSSLSATNDPLIVIDGVPVANDDIAGARNVLNIVNPNDVESITVLKDASATAIYGSRASNGVVMITTKKGSSGETGLRTEYNGSLAFSNIVQTADVLSADEYRGLVNSYFADGHPARTLMGTENTDWQEQIYQTGVMQDHNLSIAGKLGFLPFRASWGLTDRDGILKTDNFNRITAAVNLNPSFFDNKLQFNVNFKAMSDRNHFADRGAIGSAMQFDPTQPVTVGDNPYGGYFTWLNNDGNPNTLGTANPLALLNLKEDDSHVSRYLLNASADYRFWFLPALHANLNVGFDKSYGSGTIFIPKNAAFAFVDGGRDEVYNQTKRNKLLEFYLNYGKKIGRSNLDLMAGYSWQHFFRDNYVFATNIDKDRILKPEDRSPKEYYLLSLFGRLNYSFDDRYFLTASLRRDGTSRFSEDNRWGMFPAAALAVKVVDRPKAGFSGLKLRLGFGVTGQQDINSDYYPYLARYLSSTPTAQYQLGNQFINTLRPEGYDANIKWEETTTYNAAFDYGFWGNRVTGAVEVYLRKTKDLINYIPVAAGTNLTNFINTNVGDLENRGVEFSINTLPWKGSRGSWSIGFNVAYNENKITRLTKTEDPNYQGVAVGGISGGVGNNIQIHSVGYSANSFFVYEQVYDNAGTPIEGLYVDRNGDGRITVDDRYRLEKPAPDYLMGFNTAVSLGKFDFSAAGRANVGNFIYNNNQSNNAFYNQLYGSTNVLRNVLSETSAIDFTVPQYFSDHFIQDASFMRIDHVTAGYTFGKIGRAFESLRLSVTVQNPLLITKYDGLDPEVFGGIDNNVYPRSRTFLFGVRANF
jgi:TonB-linked SusC/RagA family outer membrane protein